MLVCDLASAEEDEGGDNGDAEEDGHVGHCFGFDAEEAQGGMEGGEVRKDRVHLPLGLGGFVPIGPEEGDGRATVLWVVGVGWVGREMR